MLVAQWGGVKVWELYGGDPQAWAPWYEIVCSAVEAAKVELNKPKEPTES